MELQFHIRDVFFKLTNKNLTPTSSTSILSNPRGPRELLTIFATADTAITIKKLNKVTTTEIIIRDFLIYYNLIYIVVNISKLPFHLCSVPNINNQNLNAPKLSKYILGTVE